MKLTEFYLKPKHKTDYASLYALSDDKELVKLFKKSRNLNKFLIRKIDIDKDELNKIKARHSSYFLKKTSLKTYINHSSLPTVIHLVTTFKEEMDVFQQAENLLSKSMPDFPEEMYVFNEKYTKLLNDLLYYDNISFYATRNLWQYEHMSMCEDEYGHVEYIYTGDPHIFLFDELNIFIKLYGYTMKNKG